MQARSIRHLVFLFLLFFTSFVSAQPLLVQLKTNMGSMTIELYPDKAPITVANFLRYVDESFYDATIFHRVIKDFMLQGGGFNALVIKKDTHDPIQNEAKNGLKNTRGSIAMARTRLPHSATSQFFINHADNDFLDYPARDGWGYCVFGRVIEGMNVVNSIAVVPTKKPNQPIETVLIESIRRLPIIAEPIEEPADKKLLANPKPH